MNFQIFSSITSTISDTRGPSQTLKRDVLQYITYVYILFRLYNGKTIGPARRTQHAGALVREQFSVDTRFIMPDPHAQGELRS